MAQGHACLLPMPSPAEFLNRLEDLYRTAAPPPKLILISFPHNPTTTCVELDFFRQIVALASRRPLGEGYVRFALVENEHRIRQATRSIAKFLK